MERAKRIISFPFKWLWGKEKEPTPEELLQVKLMPYQRYLHKFQQLVLWSDPSQTFGFLAVVNFLFFFLGSLNLRFYSVVCWASLFMIAYEAWAYKIWPVIKTDQVVSKEADQPQQSTPEGTMSVSELSKFVAGFQSFTLQAFVYFKTLRTTHPSTFCGVMSTILLVLIQIGSAVSAFWLLYIVTMGVILTPGVLFKLMSPEMRNYLASTLSRLALLLEPKAESPDKVVEEFLPEPNKENLTLFNLASGDAIDKTNLSTPCSDMELVLPADPIPGHDESSIDTIGLPESVSLPSVTDSGLMSSLSFTPTHFNGTTLSAALRKALADTLGPNLVATVVEETTDEQDHSDSSEFELLDPDDDDDDNPAT